MLEKLILSPSLPIIRSITSLNFKKRELDALARAAVFIFAETGTDTVPLFRPLLSEAVAGASTCYLSAQHAISNQEYRRSESVL